MKEIFEQTAVLIPTYNEKDNIAKLCRDILAICPDLNIFVIDDNSPDGTGSIVRGLADVDPRIFLISRKRKSGLGAAYIEGMETALKGGYGAVLMMDGDFSHDPSHIPAMIKELQHCHVIIGSRYVKGGSLKNWPWFRKLLSFSANALLTLFFCFRVKDGTSGFRLIRTGVLESIHYREITSSGYSFLYEMLFRIYKKGYIIKEVPITFIDRRFGVTKISQNEIIKAFFTLLRLLFKRC